MKEIGLVMLAILQKWRFPLTSGFSDLSTRLFFCFVFLFVFFFPVHEYFSSPEKGEEDEEGEKLTEQDF